MSLQRLRVVAEQEPVAAREKAALALTLQQEQQAAGAGARLAQLEARLREADEQLLAATGSAAVLGRELAAARASAAAEQAALREALRGAAATAEQLRLESAAAEVGAAQAVAVPLPACAPPRLERHCR